MTTFNIRTIAAEADQKLEVDFGDLNGPAITAHLELLTNIETVLFAEDKSSLPHEARIEAIRDGLLSLVSVLDETPGTTFEEVNEHILKLREVLSTTQKVHLLLNGETLLLADEKFVLNLASEDSGINFLGGSDLDLAGDSGIDLAGDSGLLLDDASDVSLVDSDINLGLAEDSDNVVVSDTPLLEEETKVSEQKKTDEEQSSNKSSKTDFQFWIWS